MSLPTAGLVIGLLSDVLGLWDKVTGPAPAEAIVSVDDVRLSQHGEVDVESTDFEGGTYTENYAATQVTISLTNRGSAAEAFFAIEAKVLEAASLQDCFVAGGDLEISGNYNIPLPPPTPGARTEAQIAWEVRGLSNDRLGVTIGQPGSTTSRTVPIYRLELSLLRGQEEPLSIGPIIVANELPHYGSFFDPEAPLSGCPEMNREEFTSLLALEGERSPELAAFADAVEEGVDLAALPVRSCPRGLSRSLQDLQPLNLPSTDHRIELALAIECGDGEDMRTLVALPRGNDTILEYVPPGQAALMDMTVLSGELTLDYRRSSVSGQYEFVREKLVVRDGVLQSNGIELF